MEVAALYPGWLMRLYYLIEPDDVSGKSQLCTLSCQYDHLDLCDVTNIPQPVGNLKELQPIGEQSHHLFFCNLLNTKILLSYIKTVRLLSW
jgi:hypothetical protein